MGQEPARLTVSSHVSSRAVLPTLVWHSYVHDVVNIDRSL